MPSDYAKSKEGLGGQLLDGVIETTWQDSGPLVTAAEVKRMHLFGIPLVSAIVDPYTGMPEFIGPETLSEYIVEAVSIVETETGLEIFPRQRDERHPYDQKAQESFGYTVLRHRPVQSIEKLAVTSTDGVDVWQVPTAWIDTGYLHQGQINLIPFAIAGQGGSTVPVTGPVGMGLLPSLFRFHWVPGIWTVTYTTGFKNGCIPKIVNHLIGVVASMEILSMLATTYSKSQSSSLSIDGMSQSVSTPGPQLFDTRLMVLGEKRKWLVNKLKRLFGLGFWSDNV